MLKLNPYLNFDGNCKTAFEFYQSVFNKPAQFMYYKDIPPSEDTPALPPEAMERVIHACLAINENFVLMASDIHPLFSPPLQIGNNAHLSIQADDATEAKRIFNALAEKGNITMPIAETFFADLFGMVTDQFGTQWMINVGNK